MKIIVKMLKYLFYDMIPEVYDIKWYKYDFDDKLEYYYWLPFRYLGFLIISLLDFEVMLYRIAFILGAVKVVFNKWQE